MLAPTRPSETAENCDGPIHFDFQKSIQILMLRKLIITWLIANVNLAYAQNSVSSSSLTAGEFIYSLSKSEREIYSIGIIDGFLAASLLGGDISRTQKLKSCTFLMDRQSISSVIEKHIISNADLTESPINLAAFLAIRKYCAQKGLSIN